MYRGGKETLHPITVLIFTVSAGIMALVFTNPVYLLALLAVIVIAVIGARAGLQLRRYILCMLPVLISIILLNGLFCGEGATVIFKLPRMPLIGGRAVTIEALLYGLNMAIKLALIISIFCLYNAIQDNDTAFSFFSRFAFSSLFAVIVSTLMVPRMKRDMDRIGASMRKRGVSFSSGSILSRVKAAHPLVKVLLLSSLEGSLDSAESMHCRAFGSGPRTFSHRLQMRGRDWIVIAASIFSLSGFAVGAFAGRGFTVFYPSLGRLFEVPDTVFLAWILSGYLFVSFYVTAALKLPQNGGLKIHHRGGVSHI